MPCQVASLGGHSTLRSVIVSANQDRVHTGLWTQKLTHVHKEPIGQQAPLGTRVSPAEGAFSESGSKTQSD